MRSSLPPAQEHGSSLRHRCDEPCDDDLRNFEGSMQKPELAINTRILLADDHPIFREGLVALIEKVPGMKVVRETNEGLQAVNAARELRPDVVVMDLTMPGMNGIEATRRIREEIPETKILCLSVHTQKRFISAVLDMGASGYLPKDCAFEELVGAIRTVMRNQNYLSPAITGTILEDYKSRRPTPDASVFSRLTEREREIMQLLAEGHSTKEIAARLHLSGKTVGTHREHLMSKLKLHTVAGLTKYAIREGLTSI